VRSSSLSHKYASNAAMWPLTQFSAVNFLVVVKM
jgi:hypothetical protein